mgnify:CR=1 FL=1
MSRPLSSKSRHKNKFHLLSDALQAILAVLPFAFKDKNEPVIEVQDKVVKKPVAAVAKTKVKEDSKKQAVKKKQKNRPPEQKTAQAKTRRSVSKKAGKDKVREKTQEQPVSQLEESLRPYTAVAATTTAQDNQKQNFEGMPLLQAFEKMQRDDGVEAPASLPDNFTISKIKEWNDEYSASCARVINRNKEVYLTIGFDFGTSCAKIVVQIAFAEEQSVAFEVPEYFQADSHPHLWKTAVYYNPYRGVFTLFPERDSILIKNLKTSMMQEGQQDLYHEGNIVVNDSQACAAYIGLLLRCVKGWICKETLFPIDLNDCKIKWEINFGMPAATLDSSHSSDEFRRMFEIASRISESDEEVSLSFLKKLFLDKRKEPLINIRPEVAAEAMGLIRSEMADYGFYVLIDIGASTLDTCTFNYFRKDASEKQALYVANVELVGAESPRWLETLNQLLDSPICWKKLETAIYTAMGDPIGYTKEHRNPLSKVWNGKENLRILLAGGGVKSKIHQLQLEKLEKVFLNTLSIREIEFIDPIVPKTLQLSCSEDTYDRLAVAWGLSIHSTDSPDTSLPSAMEDFSAPRRDVSDDFISKDQM